MKLSGGPTRFAGLIDVNHVTAWQATRDSSAHIDPGTPAVPAGGTASDRGYLWIDPTSAFVAPTETDIAGAATIPLPPGFPPATRPSLRGPTADDQWLVLSNPQPTGFSGSDAPGVVLD